MTRLDNSETPIDKLSEDVELGASLIKDLSKKLKQVEMEVRDAFKELEKEGDEGVEADCYLIVRSCPLNRCVTNVVTCESTKFSCDTIKSGLIIMWVINIQHWLDKTKSGPAVPQLKLKVEKLSEIIIYATSIAAGLSVGTPRNVGAGHNENHAKVNWT